ncbi:MAG: ATP-binding protein [Elusimicrobiales bacterium]|nr:ATP-binding protein [Elusimicrobiales bacterium]
MKENWLKNIWLSTGTGFKLTLVVCATALLTISIFAYVNIRTHSASLLAEVERHANQLSESVRLSTEYDMLLNHRERLHESIRRVGNQRSIQRIRVMNKTGMIIYSSDAAEIGRMVDQKGESCYMCHAAGRPLERLEIKDRTRVYRPGPGASRILGTITPIYNAPSCWTAACHAHPKEKVVLGVLDVTMPLAEVDKDIRRGQLEIAVFALSAILALSLITGFFVRRLVAAPVAELVEATRRIAGGELGHTIPERADDELGLLAKSFNNMTHKLSEARLQLVQSDKLASLGRLAAGVAHEINNPLTGVLTYSSFLLKHTQDRPDLQEDLKIIVREAIRSREIVKSLLDFARQSVPRKAEADINSIIGHTEAVINSQLALNKVKVVRELDPSLPKVKADASQLEQVFMNLFVNAADAIGPAGGVITVSSSVLKLPPSAVAQVRKALCPKRHSLIDAGTPIAGKPSVRLKVTGGGAEGFLHLSALYGAGGQLCNLPSGAAGPDKFACPECGTSLNNKGVPCPACGGPTYAFEAPPWGLLEGCAVKGCGWQRWQGADDAGHLEFVELRVSDTGCGIEQENLQKIFEPFYSTKGQKGTGLGLAVIWGIIDNHGGTISVESKVGAGTTFIIRLPVSA